MIHQNLVHMNDHRCFIWYTQNHTIYTGKCSKLELEHLVPWFQKKLQNHMKPYRTNIFSVIVFLSSHPLSPQFLKVEQDANKEKQKKKRIGYYIIITVNCCKLIPCRFKNWQFKKWISCWLLINYIWRHVFCTISRNRDP